MPVAKDPSTELVFISPILPTSSKISEPDVILSPEEKSRRIAAKKAQIEAQRAFNLSMLQRPIMPGNPILASTNPVFIEPAPMATKKPNILLIIGVAVVGLLVVRKILN